jgi:hypothetical protein
MMKNFLVLLFISVSFIFLGCGEKKTESPLDQLTDKAKEMENLGEKMKEATEGFTEGKKVNPVDFRELKSLLPEDIGSFKRTNIEGEKVNAMGMNISHADASYSDQDGNQSIDLKVTDLGSVSGLSGLAAYGWYMVDIDKETETGYEKTFTYKGNKGFESYDNQGKHGEVSVLVTKRFVIEVNGNQVTMDQIKAAVDKIDIGKLESWKNFGIEEK